MQKGAIIPRKKTGIVFHKMHKRDAKQQVTGTIFITISVSARN